MESFLPPGFRFHPTDEELVGYYLKRKINFQKIEPDVIVDIDLYKIEPWDIQASCNLGYEEQKEWYFFSHKDRKYPTGSRTNRATTAGFWKATGRDKPVVSKNRVIGMRKTLVFYKGRAPNGKKTDWIIHEYRLQMSEHGPPQEEGWVICRAFRKPTPSHNQGFEATQNHAFYYATDNSHFRSPLASNTLISMPNINEDDQFASFHSPYGSNQENFPLDISCLDTQLTELPKMESPTLSTSFGTGKGLQNKNMNSQGCGDDKITKDNNSSQPIDWKVLDSLFMSQASSSFSFPHFPAASQTSIFGSFSD